MVPSTKWRFSTDRPASQVGRFLRCRSPVAQVTIEVGESPHAASPRAINGGTSSETVTTIALVATTDRGKRPAQPARLTFRSAIAFAHGGRRHVTSLNAIAKSARGGQSAGQNSRRLDAIPPDCFCTARTSFDAASPRSINTVRGHHLRSPFSTAAPSAHRMCRCGTPPHHAQALARRPPP